MNRSASLFLRVLTWRPGRAVAIAYWYLTRRRVRARNRLQDATASSPFAYDAMIGLVEDQAGVIAKAPGRVAAWADPPLFSILMPIPGGADPALVAAAVASIERQCYDRWEIVIAGAASPALHDHRRVRIVTPRPRHGGDALALALDAAAGSIVVPWTIGTQFASTALFRFAEAFQAAPDTAIAYGDQDSVDRRGHRSTPWLKPEWNGEMILALDFASRACAIQAGRARAAMPEAAGFPGCAAYALLLAATRDDDARVAHVAHIVAHVRQDRAPGDLSA
uniref:hypothetical protein n=1 Tax=Sphingomonas bacterium TaxID=1895847 RepID=UPI001C2CF59A